MKQGVDEGLRRFLADLRYGIDRRVADRRLGERRMHARAVAVERRGPKERRRGIDRRARERRGPPPALFSAQDTDRIREMVAHPGPDASCPRCCGNLLLGPITALTGGTIQEVHCTNCRHGAVLLWS